MQFSDNSDEDVEYEYDQNGNMTNVSIKREQSKRICSAEREKGRAKPKDLNANITRIQYNCLNLPSRIYFTNRHVMDYVYNADGELLQMSARALHQLPRPQLDTKYYAGNVIFTGRFLSMLLTDEGYVTFASNGTPTYHYYLKDHLGNVRVVFNQTGTVEQRNDYYPSGALMATSTGGSVQPYKYNFSIERGKRKLACSSEREKNRQKVNGKELERTAGLDLYDYGAWWMDAALGRFTTIDPMCEKYYGISPYAYCAGNPIRFVDPNGCLFGNYYNLSGKYIGTDGIDDDKYYFVLNAQEQKTVKKNDKNKSTTELSTLSSVVEVPSNAVIERIEETYKRSETSGNEHGFQVGIKGTVTSITEGSPDAITNWDDLISELKQAGDLIAYDVHAHTLGNEDFYGKAEPSPTDIQNVVTSSGQPSIVLGYEQISPFPNPNMIGGQMPYQFERRIGFYNSNGLIDKPIPFSQFKTAVKKINKTR